MQEHNRIPTHTLSDSDQVAWVSHYTSCLELSADRASEKAIFDSGNIYVTETSDSTFTGIDYLTAMYDPSGSLVWEVRYDGAKNEKDRAYSTVIDDGCVDFHLIVQVVSHKIATRRSYHD